MKCKHRGCPFRMSPCPDHDAETIELFSQKTMTLHRQTWPVSGPGYDRRHHR